MSEVKAGILSSKTYPREKIGAAASPSEGGVNIGQSPHLISVKFS
jgi:hypothetical protein